MGGGNDALPESLNTLDASSQKNSDGGNEIARLSYFGRLQYDYENKYLFEANIRSDASSRFPKETAGACSCFLRRMAFCRKKPSSRTTRSG